MNKIYTAIHGLGNIGFKYDLDKSNKFVDTHYRAVTINRKFKLVAGIDNNKNAIKLFKDKTNISAFLKIKDLKEKVNNIDLFIVSSNHESHLSCVREIVKYFRPKLILCEKPVCKNLLQAKKILEICKRKNIKIYTNYLRRNEKKIIGLKRFLNHKKNKMEVLYSKDILTNASHFIDLSIFYFGHVESMEVRKNKLNKVFFFKLYFKNAEVVFKKVSVKDKLKNTFSIKNNSYLISQNKNFILIKSKKGLKKLKKNKKLMIEYSKELFKAFNNKKTLLANGKNALDVHNIINRINIK